MSLTKYKQKRDFKNTPEPRSGKSKDAKLSFVVQRHDATQLHFDFRLEMDGVLKSWAVPKGPSLNPADKRLAMEVEDHPYDYKDFEGVIPEGNYGAGTVYIWDKGTYEMLDDSADPLKEWKSGSIKVILHGKKLKGEFALVRMKSAGEKAWLLIKHNDRYATEETYHIDDYTPQKVLNKDKEHPARGGSSPKGATSKKNVKKKPGTK